MNFDNKARKKILNFIKNFNESYNIAYTVAKKNY